MSVAIDRIEPITDARDLALPSGYTDPSANSKTAYGPPAYRHCAP
jgi:hypothetical protein